MSDTPIFDEVCNHLLVTPDPPPAWIPPPPPPPREVGEWFQAPTVATQAMPVIERRTA